jgi:hypothetical protein
MDNVVVLLLVLLCGYLHTRFQPALQLLTYLLAPLISLQGSTLI